MYKDIPEINERFPNLDERLKAIQEFQKVLDEPLAPSRAARAAREAEKQRLIKRIKEEKARRAEIQKKLRKALDNRAALLHMKHMLYYNIASYVKVTKLVMHSVTIILKDK